MAGAVGLLKVYDVCSASSPKLERRGEVKERDQEQKCKLLSSASPPTTHATSKYRYDSVTTAWMAASYSSDRGLSLSVDHQLLLQRPRLVWAREQGAPLPSLPRSLLTHSTACRMPRSCSSD
jgi:hypothetical protein